MQNCYNSGDRVPREKKHDVEERLTNKHIQTLQFVQEVVNENKELKSRVEELEVTLNLVTRVNYTKQCLIVTHVNYTNQCLVVTHVNYTKQCLVVTHVNYTKQCLVMTHVNYTKQCLVVTHVNYTKQCLVVTHEN